MNPNHFDLISEEGQAAIRAHLMTHAHFLSEAEFHECFSVLLRLASQEVANAISQERQCWFLQRIGRPCRR